MNNENEKQNNLKGNDGWGDFTGHPFLKISECEELTLGKVFPFVVKSVSTLTNDEGKKPVVSLIGEYNGNTYRHDLNVTNARFIRDNTNFGSPTALVGQVINFKVEEVLNLKHEKVLGVRIESVK